MGGQIFPVCFVFVGESCIREANAMQSESFWQLFRETGEPVCWLIYRRLRPEPEPELKTAAVPPGNAPGV